MVITRRQALAGSCLSTISLIGLRGSAATPANRVEIVSEPHLLSRESASAFRSVLTEQAAISRPTTLLTGVRNLSMAGAEALRRAAASGVRIICECGLAFSDSESVESQRRLLAQVFGLELGQSRTTTPGAIYVKFHESSSLIRPFGLCFPVSGAGCKPVAYWGEATVAVRQKIGAGEFVYLGAMLGPHLLASDPDALRAATHLLVGSSL